MTQPNADKLKGCSFLACKGHKTGSKPRFCSTPDHYITSEKAFWVECSYCGVHSPSGETREEAAQLWNTRTDARPAPRVGEWATMDSAPRDGSKVDLLLTSGEQCEDAEWSNDRYCMLGRRAGSYKPGWAIDGHLPVADDDAPTHWRPAPPAGEMK